MCASPRVVDITGSSKGTIISIVEFTSGEDFIYQVVSGQMVVQAQEKPLLTS